MDIKAFDIGNGKFRFELPADNDYNRIDGRYGFFDIPKIMSDIRSGKIQLQTEKAKES